MHINMGSQSAVSHLLLKMETANFPNCHHPNADTESLINYPELVVTNLPELHVV
jgi:hypothetical protein